MKTVVIIGAGPAGITAAYELLKGPAPYQVIVLEASVAIGGISRTVKWHENRMDIGGHRFFSKNKEVMSWWNQMMPLQGAPALDDLMLEREKEYAGKGPDPAVADRVMLLRDRWSRIYYQGKFFDYPVRMSVNTFKNMGICQTMKAGFSYLASVIHKRPEDNLENFYINRFGKVLYAMFFEGYTEKLWGRHPREISAEWGAQRVKGLSVTAILADIFGKIFGAKNRRVETSLIEQFYYPKYGPGQLWELTAAEVTRMGGDLRLNARVKTLETAAGKITGVVYHDGEREIRVPADYVISSMPLNDLVLAMGPQVPEPVAKIAAGLPYRDFVTVGLLLKKMKLKNKTNYRTLGDIVPDCWIYVQEPSVKAGRIQIFNNWSPYMVKDPEHSVWVGMEYFCRENDGFWQMSKQQCIDFAVNELIKMGMIESAEDVLDAHREQVKKAYPAYFDTYHQIDRLKDYLDQHENLFCVGRNGQHRYNNMDHSMLTAFTAVSLLRSGEKSKAALWQVNTEQEYHEEKNKDSTH